MKHILILTKSYFHKAKGQAASLIALIAIAVMLLNIGLIMQSGMGTFFDERAEEINAGHFITVIDPSIDLSEVEQFLKDHETVTDIEHRDVLFNFGDIYVGDQRFTDGLILATMNNDVTIDALSLIGDYLPLTGDVIYIPHVLMVNNSYEIGDMLNLGFADQDLSFTIGGSTEEIMFGSTMNVGFRFYISDEKFDQLQTELPDTLQRMVTTRGNYPEDSRDLFNDFNGIQLHIQGTNELAPAPFTMHYGGARNARVIFPEIIGISIVAISGILLAISTIVVRFRIKNNIEEQIKNIGVLKALGHKSRQLIQTLLLQFGGMAVIGGVFGILGAFIVLPMVAVVMQGQIALIWEPSVDLVIALIGLALAIGLILLITYLSARRIKKVSVLVALHGGVTTHNFKKNHFSLEKAKGSLVALLSLKQMAQSVEQMAMMMLIVAGLMFSVVASLTLYYNLAVNTEAFSRAMIPGFSDVILQLDDNENVEEMQARINDMSEVEHIIFGMTFGVSANINEIDVGFFVVEDAAFMSDDVLVDGRFPLHANEIAISPVIENGEDLAIGEVIVVSRGAYEEEFLITGTIQAMTHAGFYSLATSEGMARIYPEFTFSSLNVDLAADVDIAEFVTLIENLEGDSLLDIIDAREQAEAQIGGIGAATAPLASGSIIVSSVIIVLVLYMTIKTMMRRRYKELGIQKAIGFTNLQLMNQIALSLLPIVVVGTLVGALLGNLSFNAVFVTLLSGMGIGSVNLPTPTFGIIMVIIGVAILAYVTAMLMARRIRKISAYQLVSE